MTARRVSPCCCADDRVWYCNSTDRSAEGFDYTDARCAAFTDDRKWVITTPNMEFIPTPPIGILEVVLREDYRYGMVDPIQWPQLYSAGYEYLCALQRRREAPHRLARLWWTPDEGEDFQLLQGCTIKTLGLLRPECVRELSGMVDDLVAEVADSDRRRLHVVDDRVLWLTTAMRHARDRLRNFACTFRDAAMQVREVQRYWLMTRAYLDYYGTYIRLGWRSNPLNTDLMGAFTTDPGVVQNLYEAGIPVWFVRQDASLLESTVVYELTKLEPPRGVSVNAGPQHGAVLYRGLVGRKHLDMMARGGHTYLDISRAPILIVETEGGYATPVSRKQYSNERTDEARTAQQTTTQRNGVRGSVSKRATDRDGRATNRDGRGYHPCKTIWNTEVPCADPIRRPHKTPRASAGAGRGGEVRRSQPPMDASGLATVAGGSGLSGPCSREPDLPQELGILDPGTRTVRSNEDGPTRPQVPHELAASTPGVVIHAARAGREPVLHPTAVVARLPVRRDRADRGRQGDPAKRPRAPSLACLQQSVSAGGRRCQPRRTTRLVRSTIRPDSGECMRGNHMGTVRAGIPTRAPSVGPNTRPHEP